MNPLVLNKRLVKLYDEIDVAVMAIALDGGEILYCNHCVSVEMETPMSDMVGRPYYEVFWKDFTKSYEQLLEQCRDGQPHTGVYYWPERSYWEQISGRVVKWTNDRDVFLLTITNITEAAQEIYQHKQMSNFDGLLNIPNGNRLERDIAKLKEGIEEAGLICFEVTNLTGINDLYGWQVGDYLLLQIRNWLLDSAKNKETLYRINDTCFSLFATDVPFALGEERIAEIVARFALPWILPPEVKGFPLYCDLQIGMVYGTTIRGDIRHLLFRTLHAPEYKSRGYALYDEKADRAVEQKLMLRQQLTSCVRQEMEGFSVVYHPIVQGSTGRWLGAEALCRWTPPGGEPVPPLVFISEAEKLGFVDRIDNWVCRTAINQCQAMGLGERNFYLDVNFSPTRQVDDVFCEKLGEILATTGYPPGKLTLEITESEKVNFSGENLSGLRRLSQMGIVLALDDFGTGYSSFDNLIRLPAKVLKTERLFIRGLEKDGYLQYLMRMLVDLAHRVGMAVIAEGVESPEQCAVLRRYGVDYMQGYLFSKPLSAEVLGRKAAKYT